MSPFPPTQEIRLNAFWVDCPFSSITCVLGLTYIEEISFPYRSDVHGVQIVCNRVFTQRYVQHTAVFSSQLRTQSRLEISFNLWAFIPELSSSGKRFQVLIINHEVIGIAPFHERFTEVVNDLVTFFGSQVSHGSHEPIAACEGLKHRKGI